MKKKAASTGEVAFFCAGTRAFLVENAQPHLTIGAAPILDLLGYG